jgi:hypothetical protein
VSSPASLGALSGGAGIEVLDLVTEGWSNRAMAGHLHLTDKT